MFIFAAAGKFTGMLDLLNIVLQAEAGALALVVSTLRLAAEVLQGTNVVIAGMTLILALWTAATTRGMVIGLFNSEASVMRLLSQALNIGALMIMVLIAPDDFLIAVLIFATIFYSLMEVWRRWTQTGRGVAAQTTRPRQGEGQRTSLGRSIGPMGQPPGQPIPVQLRSRRNS